MDREQAEAALHAVGLSRERCGEADWELAIREQIDRVASRDSTPLVGIRSKLTKILTERSDSPPAPPLPPREYQCPRCEDAQWVLTSRDGGIRRGPVPCPECVPLDTRLVAAGVEPRYLTARLDTLIERDGNAHAVRIARVWDGVTSLVLYSRGAPGDSDWGTGKTHLAMAMIASRVTQGLPARAIAMQDFLEEMKSRFDGDGEQAQAYADRIAAEPLLLLDDLGKEQPTAWALSQVYRLVNARWKGQRPTIITTNAHSAEELAGTVGGAVASRLRDFLWVPVGGTDMRGAQ